MNDYNIAYPPVPPTIRRALNDAVYHFAIDGSNHSRQVSDRLIGILKKRAVHVSAKQVPSCTLLRKPGSPSVWRNREDLISAGFDIEMSTGSSWEKYQRDPSHMRWGEFISASQVSALSSAMSSIKIENSLIEERAMRLDASFEYDMKTVNERPESESEISDPETDSGEFELENTDYERGREKYHGSRIVYEDAFEINAALVYAETMSKDKPTVYAWEADVVRLTDPIPSRLLGKKWTGRRSAGVPFSDIRSIDVREHVIFNKTHWGHLLKEFCLDKTCIEHVWAKRLKSRIRYMLLGRHDPLWNKETICRIYGTRDYAPRDTKKRSVRFSQLLLTVDGIFQQRYLAFPNEIWNWSKFDRFILGCISHLIGDEFIDGEIENISLSTVKTAYSQLKATRQSFKEAANNGSLSELLEMRLPMTNPFLEIFRKSYESYLEIKDPHIRLRVRGTLNQTRGAGSPPPLVAIQTKLKFIQTVMDKPAPLEEVERALIRGTTRNLMSRIPNEAFTGLQTKAGISATSSSCYERTRIEGGTTQAVQDMVFEGTIGRPCRIIDLDTGKVESEKFLSDCTPGEYIFWRALEETLATPLETLKTVSIVVVSEPGKARSVTKGHASLKVVLDVVNALCSWPLQKGVESSSSGMGKEAHGWNFFKSLFYGELAEAVFHEAQVSSTTVDPVTKIVTRRYTDVFCLSTDYETATDFLHHEVADIIGNEWMIKVGIPPVLRGIVRATCYKPRRVEFAASGFFREIGDPTDRENVRVITLSRGVLMGDPLTKVVLHLVNIGVRDFSSGINRKDWLSRFATNSRTILDQIAPDGGEFSPPRKVST